MPNAYGSETSDLIPVLVLSANGGTKSRNHRERDDSMSPETMPT